MKTPITYYGGKQILTHEILELMPAHKIILQEYCEANSWNIKVISLKSMIPALIHKPRRKYEVLVWNYTQEQSQLKFE